MASPQPPISKTNAGLCDIRTRKRVWAVVRDQLQRPSTSIAFNIAEGAGEYAMKEKARFYRIGNPHFSTVPTTTLVRNAGS